MILKVINMRLHKSLGEDPVPEEEENEQDEGEGETEGESEGQGKETNVAEKDKEC